jgi:diguanylate cyclase (GGDEF)-like protein
LIRVIFILFICLSPFIRAADTLHVLVFYRGTPEATVSRDFAEGLQIFEQQHAGEVVFYHEFLDKARLKRSVGNEAWLTYLKDKYQDIPIGAIIADNDDSSRFISNAIPDFFPNTLKILQSENNASDKANTHILQKNFKQLAYKTLQLALDHNPNITEIVYVASDSSVNNKLIKYLKEAIAIEQDITLKTIINEPLSVITYELAILPKSSAVLYAPVFSDKNGTHYFPMQVIKEMVEASTAPIYSFWSVFLETGLVGGFMEQPRLVAQALAAQALAVHQGRSPSLDVTPANKMVDYTAMVKFDLLTSSIDENTITINTPLPFWIAHEEFFKTLIISLILLFIITSIYIRRLHQLNDTIELSRINAEDQARKDFLTDIPNRRAFFEFAETAISLTRRKRESISVIIFDIDDFKNINDSHGHDSGDEVIKKIAAIITQCKREHDICARIGGEEFAILLPMSTLEQGIHLAERVRQEVAQTTIRNRHSELTVTVSAGVSASVALNSKNATDILLQFADQALYSAKMDGKNRVHNATIDDVDVAMASGKSEPFRNS